MLFPYYITKFFMKKIEVGFKNLMMRKFGQLKYQTRLELDR